MLSLFVANFPAAPVDVYVKASLDQVVDEEVDEVFSRTKTEETAQKAGQKLRAVTYHAASIRDHVTTIIFSVK